MRKAIAILITKITTFFLKKIGRGSSTPGKIALAFYPEVLKTIKIPKLTIVVTGSSGKTTTTNMIANVLKEAGYKVSYNEKGSNLIHAVVTTILNETKLNGVLKSDALVIELDERYVKRLFKDISPEYLVITNITKDQPPRNGHYDAVWNEVLNSLNDDIKLILNGDDPYCRSLGLQSKNAVYFGSIKNNRSYTKSISNNLEMMYCKNCGGKLNFEYFQYENIGKYKCNGCDFKTPEAKYKPTNINFKNKKIIINNECIIKLPHDMSYIIYNILATYALCKEIDIDSKVIEKSFKHLNLNHKRYKKYDFNNRKITLISCKNENSPSYNQALLYTKNIQKPTTYIFGFRKISHRYKHKDISWLWDINFELLNDRFVEKIICIGPNAYDLATRINIAGINKNKIITDFNYNNLLSLMINQSEKDIYAILNLDIADYFDEILEGKKL